MFERFPLLTSAWANICSFADMYFNTDSQISIKLSFYGEIIYSILLQVLEAYAGTEWKSKNLTCYKLLEAITMFRIILVVLMVCLASGEGKYIHRDLTILMK